MNKSLGMTALVLACLLCSGSLSPARAAGPMGVNIGWAIDNNGNPLLTSALCTQLSQGKTGWVRVEFRLIPGHSTWDSAMLGYYDTVINNAHNAGLQVLGLVDASAWPGSQTDWCANNHEHTGGNGDNTYIDGFANSACVTIIKHFHDRVKNWEIWNEPNSWTSSQPGGYYTGGSYLYPSNYSQVLANVYADVKEYNGLQDVSILFGGVFGHSIGGVYSYGNAGAQYIDDTYNAGINAVGSFAYTKSHWGTYPVDGVCQHVYIDQGGATSSTEFKQYLDWVRQAYTKYEGASTPKKTWITEFGWSTTSVSQAVQDQNLNTTFGVIRGGSVPYVSNALWFEWQDNPPANLYFGVLDSSGAHKTAYPDYQAQETYEGYYANGTVNSAIQSYFNARGQAQMGDPYNNGGGAFVHTWAGGGYTTQVQDCSGGSQGRLAIFNASPGTFEVNDTHGLWDFYLAHGGIGGLGAPTDNQYTSGSGVRQDFQAHYLTWDSTNGVVEH